MTAPGGHQHNSSAGSDLAGLLGDVMTRKLVTVLICASLAVLSAAPATARHYSGATYASPQESLDGIWGGEASSNRVSMVLRSDGLYVSPVTNNPGQTPPMVFQPVSAREYRHTFANGSQAVVIILGDGVLRVTNPDGWTDVFRKEGGATSPNPSGRALSAPSPTPRLSGRPADELSRLCRTQIEAFLAIAMRTPDLAANGDVSRGAAERTLNEGYIDRYLQINDAKELNDQVSLDLYYMETSSDADRFPSYIDSLKKVVSCVQTGRTAQIVKGVGLGAPSPAPTTSAPAPAPASAPQAYAAVQSSSEPVAEVDREFQTCIDDRNPPQAIVDACSAVIRRPGQEAAVRAPLFAERGLAYSALNRFQEAISDLSTAIEIGPVQLAFFIRRAGVFKTLKQYPAAIADMTRAIEMEPKAELFEYRATLRTLTKEYNGVVSDYNEAIRLNPNRNQSNAWVYAQRGLAYDKVENYVAAAADFDRYLRLDPSNAAVHIARGKYYYDERNYAAARQHMDQAVSLEPADPTALYWRARISTAEKDDARALADLDAAVRIKSDDAEARALRADVNYRLKNYDNAISDYGAVLSSDPNRVGAYRWRARAFWEVKDAARARADIDYAISLSPREAVLYADRARFRSANDKPGAILDYDKALELDPNNAAYLNNRCWARAAQGLQLDLALADCDASIRARDAANTRNTRALVRLRRGEFQLAVDDYAEALRTTPQNASSLYGRGLALLRLGQAAAGQADLAAALALNPEVAKAYASYGLTP